LIRILFFREGRAKRPDFSFVCQTANWGAEGTAKKNPAAQTRAQDFFKRAEWVYFLSSSLTFSKKTMDRNIFKKHSFITY
jgi:hypothetical protein